LRLTPTSAAAQRAVVPATKCSIRRSCFPLLNRLFLMPSLITPKGVIWDSPFSFYIIGHTYSQRDIRRSGRMALLKNPGDAEQHNLAAATVKITRTQPGRKHLAVHARQLALKPCLQLLQRYCRSLLFRLEPTHRSAMENHVHRPSRLGP